VTDLPDDEMSTALDIWDADETVADDTGFHGTPTS
jgi:hypothetical protein